jgi:UDP-GlcNAc:undecaprenyl-phosphate/decaprenyl-phosphate GlcNAc-1-phosphate transferase
MYAMMALGVTAFLLCLVLTPICRDIFRKLNVVDRPDGERKLHGKPIPRVGGIPIALSYTLALGLMLVFAPHGAKIHVQHAWLLLSLLPAVGLVFITGLIDDLIGLRPWEKLAGQAMAAVLAVDFGARTNLLNGHAISHWFTILLSILWLIGCTNAFNLIDGLDGLASGVGLFATLTTLLAALLNGDTGLAMATIPLAGCLLAFLRYNFSPASIFLGDCGSLTIGFLLGCFGVIWSQKSATFLGMVAPMMALALPLLDVGLSIGRRFLRSAPIFKGDRMHIHHMVIARGFKPRDAVLILYAFCGMTAILALLQSVTSFHFRGLAIILFCSLSWLGIRSLNYVEFRAARNIFSQNTILRIVREEINLLSMKKLLAAARTVDECWDVVRETCAELRCASVEMSLAGHSFEKTLRDDGEPSLCQMIYPIGNNGYIRLTCAVDEKMPFLMMSVLQALQKGIDGNWPFPQMEHHVQELIPQPAFQQSYVGSRGMAATNVTADRQSLSLTSSEGREELVS